MALELSGLGGVFDGGFSRKMANFNWNCFKLSFHFSGGNDTSSILLSVHRFTCNLCLGNVQIIPPYIIFVRHRIDNVSSQCYSHPLSMYPFTKLGRIFPLLFIRRKGNSHHVCLSAPTITASEPTIFLSFPRFIL